MLLPLRIARHAANNLHLRFKRCHQISALHGLVLARIPETLFNRVRGCLCRRRLHCHVGERKTYAWMTRLVGIRCRLRSFIGSAPRILWQCDDFRVALVPIVGDRCFLRVLLLRGVTGMSRTAVPAACVRPPLDSKLAANLLQRRAADSLRPLERQLLPKLQHGARKHSVPAKALNARRELTNSFAAII